MYKITKEFILSDFCKEINCNCIKVNKNKFEEEKDYEIFLKNCCKDCGAMSLNDWFERNDYIILKVDKK